MEALIVPAKQLMAQLAHKRLHQPGSSSDADARALGAALASIDSINWCVAAAAAPLHMKCSCTWFFQHRKAEVVVTC